MPPDPSRTVFTFWEPREAMIPYLALCVETWPRVLRDHEIVVLNYANLPAYVDDALDLGLLRRVPLALQKDAVMVAVLQRHGGIFLDADTLMVRDLSPLLALLDRTEVLMFALHIGAMIARPRARLLTRWLATIADRLAALSDPQTLAREIPWEYLGNGVLSRVMDDIIRDDGDKPLPLEALERGIALTERLIGASRPGGRLVRGIRWRRRMAYFRTRYREYFTSLDRDRFAFMPERLQLRRRRRDRGRLDEQYRRYWFESDVGPETALRDGQLLIALHNSWTPEWYRRLTAPEVLAHPCRLSRTLRHLLGR